jgi:hypothetical protein
MKKFIILFAGLILAFASCTPKVEKDIKSLSAGEFKVLDVKTIDIKENFYQYTNQYAEVMKKFEAASEEAYEIAGNVGRSQAMYEIFGGETYRKAYKEAEASYKEAEAKCDSYATEAQNLENTLTAGKIYVAKVRGKDEFTGKYLDFNSYQLFSYDTDGSLHQVDSDRYMQMVCAVYPKAEKDLEKAMEKMRAMFFDALSDMDI